MDVTGIEPVTPCLQSRRKFKLSRLFGCACTFRDALKLLQRNPAKPHHQNKEKVPVRQRVEALVPCPANEQKAGFCGNWARGVPGLVKCWNWIQDAKITQLPMPRFFTFRISPSDASFAYGFSPSHRSIPDSDNLDFPNGVIPLASLHNGPVIVARISPVIVNPCGVVRIKRHGDVVEFVAPAGHLLFRDNFMTLLANIAQEFSQ